MDEKRPEHKRRKEKDVATKEPEGRVEKKRALKHDWSQTRSEVTTTLDVGVALDSNQVVLKCTENQCSVTLPDGRNWECELFAPVVPECTSLIHKSKKLVVKMLKQDPSIDWRQLEKREDDGLPEELKESRTVQLMSPKYDYYESGPDGNTVTVTLFVKSISKDMLAVNFDNEGFCVKFRTKNTNSEFLEQHQATEETTFVWSMKVKEPIRASECHYRVGACKLELVLKKKVAAKWSSLELSSKKEPATTLSNTWVAVSKGPSQGKVSTSNGSAMTTTTTATATTTTATIAPQTEVNGPAVPERLTACSSAGDASSLFTWGSDRVLSKVCDTLLGNCFYRYSRGHFPHSALAFPQRQGSAMGDSATDSASQ